MTYYASGPVHWGDIATWVGGLATAGALILTYLLLRVTRREQISQQGELARQQIEDRKAQAHRVSGWSDHIEQVSASAEHHVTVVVQNSSNEPVYSVRAAVGDSWDSGHIGFAELDLRYVLPPKSCDRQTVPLDLGTTATGEYEPTPPVELIFRDAAGRYWHRHRSGTLTEITKNLPPMGGAYFFADSG
jgi:hypothetical protein